MGTYIHSDFHAGALGALSPGCLQEPAQQHSVLWHVEVEELGIPIPAVEGQLLCTLREVLGDIQGVWKGESTAVGGGAAGGRLQGFIHPQKHTGGLMFLGKVHFVSLISHSIPIRLVIQPEPPTCLL